MQVLAVHENTDVHDIDIKEVMRCCNASGKMVTKKSCNKRAPIVLFTKEAWEQVRAFTSYGAGNTFNNIYEMQMYLAGYHCRDISSDSVFTVVCHVMYLYCEERNRIGARNTGSQAFAEKQIFTELAYINDTIVNANVDSEIVNRLGKLSLVGKLHTHPNISVFLSGTDKLGHVNTDIYWVDCVLNPQEKVMRAWTGQDILVENQIVRLVNNSLEAKHRKIAKKEKSDDRDILFFMIFLYVLLGIAGFIMMEMQIIRLFSDMHALVCK